MKKIVVFIAILLSSFQARASSLDAVQAKLFTIHDFKLDSGVVLPEITIAYETYGELSPDGRNALLVTHSFTSSQHAAGYYLEGGTPPGEKPGEPGWWDKLIGPEEAIDTDRLFVISSNALGSSYGSTSPASLDPKTGKPYGPDFPAITVADIARAQKALVDHVGVKHLVAVVGASYGGFEAFQWAVGYPDLVGGIAAIVTAPYSLTPAQADKDLVAALAKDPNWNGGHYYGKGSVAATLTKLRVEVLKSYGLDTLFQDKIASLVLREAAIKASARSWAEGFDANSLVTLLRAHETFDVRPQFGKIKAKVLYILSRSDKQFSPGIAPEVMAALKAAGVDARYQEIDSDIGHLAFAYQTEKWSPALKQFIGALQP